MGYKMKGFSGFGNSPAKQNGKKPTGKKGLRATEHEGTQVYKGEEQREKIMDLEDRIGFLKSDLEEAEGKATSMKDPGFHIKKDIASLKEELKAVRGEDRPDPEWENADEVDLKLNYEYIRNVNRWRS